MIHKNLTPFFWAPKVTSRQPPQVEMAICVRGAFVLAPDRELVAIEDPLEQGFMSGDTFAEDDIDQLGPLVRSNDFADWKLNGEVLVRGTCHPEGGSATESHVRVAVGDWSKTLRVVGPRVYKAGLLRGSASEPQPFASMPLTWQNAYGGAGYRDNVAGRGYDGEELPTVELPSERVKKSGQKGLTPASFLPVSPHWPLRAGKRGKNYGRAWRKKRAPFYSDDFDWTYHHAAPPDQQLSDYLRGDEEISFENLHPSTPSFSKELPGLRVRAFVKTTDERVHEATMNLDTLEADLDEGKLFLTWRGHVPIREIDMADVGVVLIASEPLAEAPRPAEHYLEQLRAFEADPVGLDARLPAGFAMFADAIDAVEQAELNGTPMPDLQAVADKLPPDCPFPPWFLAAAAGDEDPLGVKDQFPPGLLEGRPTTGPASELGGLADPGAQRELQEGLAEAQQDPKKLPEVLKAAAVLLPPDKQEAMQQSIGALEAALSDDAVAKAAEEASAQAAPTAADSFGQMAKGIDADLAAAAASATDAGALADAQKQLAAAPKSLDDVVAEALAPFADMEVPEMPEIPDADAQLADATAKVDAMEERMRAKFGEHPLLGLADLGRNLIENAPTPATVAPDLSAIPATLQKAHDGLSAQGISAAALAPLAALTAKVSALLAKVPQPPPLPEGEFVGKDLRGRDFSGRDLRGEAFCKADLTAASFVDADLSGADLTKANLTGADLSGATLTDATLEGVILTKAKLVGCTAHRTRLANADFGEADLTDADLLEARMNNTRGVKSVLARAILQDADLRFADLSKADLRDARLGAANLSFATLNLIKADRADLSEANLDIAKLTKCRLQDAVLRGARCTMGQFGGSNLTGADLSGCAFEKADFTKVVLDRTVLRDANLAGCQFRDVTGERTNLQRADLSGCSTTGESRFTDCDFRHVVGDRSVWMETDLTGSTLRHGSFRNAYFDAARGTDIDFTATTMKNASFRKAEFTRVSFACADLAGAIFQQARLDDADFQRSNCYDTKFLGAHAVRCRFEKAFVAGMQLDDQDQQQPGQEPS